MATASSALRRSATPDTSFPLIRRRRRGYRPDVTVAVPPGELTNDELRAIAAVVEAAIDRPHPFDLIGNVVRLAPRLAGAWSTLRHLATAAEGRHLIAIKSQGRSPGQTMRTESHVVLRR